MEITKKFTKYVSLNIFAMIGMSCYILADSYFISVAEGANGLATLNLVLPVYNLIFAIGSMIGLGAATRFAIDRARGKKESETCFSNAVIWVLLFGAVFMVAGGFFPDKVVEMMGGDGETGSHWNGVYQNLYVVCSCIYDEFCVGSLCSK